MFWRTDKLAALRKALLKHFRRQSPPDIRLLAEGQLVIRKHMIPNPATAQGLKATADIPGPNGYEIYIARRPRTDPDAPSQRMTFDEPIVWNASTTTLRIDDDSLSAHWQIISPDNQIVTIRAACGSQATLAEVNQILDRCVEILL